MNYNLYSFFNGSFSVHSMPMHLHSIWRMVYKLKIILCVYFVSIENIPDLIVWTSQMQRTIQTASRIDAPKEQWKALNEINAVDILIQKDNLIVIYLV